MRLDARDERLPSHLEDRELVAFYHRQAGEAQLLDLEAHVSVVLFLDELTLPIVTRAHNRVISRVVKSSEQDRNERS